MQKPRIIICIEDDPDDLLFIKQAIDEYDGVYKLIHFPDGLAALDFLKTTSVQPFLILCDMSMPKLNGLQLRESIEHNTKLRLKSIPFVILSANGSKKQIEEAYEMPVQGFFLKDGSHEVLKQQVTRILDYWEHSLHPRLDTGVFA